jgi:hypothetical protein
MPPGEGQSLGGETCSFTRSRGLAVTGEPDWTGPTWEDPALTTLAAQLLDAHRQVAPMPAETRRRLHRHLLAITDLAKRDPELAARRLGVFLSALEVCSDDVLMIGNEGPEARNSLTTR